MGGGLPGLDQANRLWRWMRQAKSKPPIACAGPPAARSDEAPLLRRLLETAVEVVSHGLPMGGTTIRHSGGPCKQVEGKPMSGNRLAENRYCSTPDAPFALSWKSTFLTGHNQAIHVVIARKGPRSGFLISNLNNISMLRHLRLLRTYSKTIAKPCISSHLGSSKQHEAPARFSRQKRKDDAK